MIRRASLVAIGCACLGLLPLVGSDAWSQEQQRPKDPDALRGEAEAGAWLHRLFLREMSAYEFFLDAELQHKLVMRREPVLTYPAKPLDFAGEIYVWTDRGRPAVIGCVFAGQVENTDRFRLFHEFHSLSLKPLAEVGGATGWQPEEAGIKFEPVRDMAEPEEKKDRRLTQMRAITHHFDARMIWKNMKVDLPLLTKPLYRYEVPDNDPALVDGAVFAYGHYEIQDPEVLLIVEAQRTKDGNRWYYAVARLTDRQAWVTYKGKEVWRANTGEPGIFDGVRSKRYGVFIVKEVLERVEAKEADPGRSEGRKQ
jgi:hypothetical protein